MVGIFRVKKVGPVTQISKTDGSFFNKRTIEVQAWGGPLEDRFALDLFDDNATRSYEVEQLVRASLLFGTFTLQERILQYVHVKEIMDV